MATALTLHSLGDLSNGSAGLIIQREIDTAVADVDDRGEDGKDREVQIKITLSKRSDGLVEIGVAAQAKLPPRRTAGTTARPVSKENHTRLFFQEWSQDNPDQPPFDAMGEDKNRRTKE